MSAQKTEKLLNNIWPWKPEATVMLYTDVFRYDAAVWEISTRLVANTVNPYLSVWGGECLVDLLRMLRARTVSFIYVHSYAAKSQNH